MGTMRITAKMFSALPTNLQKQVAQALLEAQSEEYRLIRVADFDPSKEVADLMATAILSPDSLIAVRNKSRRGRRKKEGVSK